MPESRSHFRASVSAKSSEGVVEKSLCLIALNDITDPRGIVEPDHELGRRISVHVGELVIVVEGHVQVSWVAVVTKEVYLGEQVESVRIVLPRGSLEKVDRIGDGTGGGRIVGLGWRGYRAGGDSFEDIPQGGSHETCRLSLSTM
jgi:hypothetical protein